MGISCVRAECGRPVIALFGPNVVCPVRSPLGVWLSVGLTVALAGYCLSRSSAGSGCGGYSMSLSRKSMPPVAVVTASWASAWPSGLLSAATAVW